MNIPGLEKLMQDFYEISNKAGMKAIVTDFGATLHSLYVPDKDGNFRDVVWGYDTASFSKQCAYYFCADVWL